ncbi:Translation initiation factor [Desmophyllum pertusum]|uniref:Translation initiation factor n=1 Tax=Desmophyllum pertusum TaxID=174260 RepID=A0A9W9ZSD5_9CNID|nr:Translation initiation factor [Desmophyllum pertusum]
MIYKNENDADGILNILRSLHKYVPYNGDKDERQYGDQGVVGDLLIVEQAANGHMSLVNGFTQEDRVEGLHFEVADWHAGNNFWSSIVNLRRRECRPMSLIQQHSVRFLQEPTPDPPVASQASNLMAAEIQLAELQRDKLALKLRNAAAENKTSHEATEGGQSPLNQAQQGKSELLIGHTSSVQVAFTNLYNASSAADKCTMYSDHTLINRRNVKGDVSAVANACRRFFQIEIEARVVAATFKVLGYEKYGIERNSPILQTSHLLASHRTNTLITSLTLTGDGNCLFDSVSLVICQNESLAFEFEFHLCTYVELAMNREFYRKHAVSVNSKTTYSERDHPCVMSVETCDLTCFASRFVRCKCKTVLKQ